MLFNTVGASVPFGETHFAKHSHLKETRFAELTFLLPPQNQSPIPFSYQLFTHSNQRTAFYALVDEDTPSLTPNQAGMPSPFVDFEEELRVTHSRVVWSQQGHICKSFTFENAVQHACFGWFPLTVGPGALEHPHQDQATALRRALCIVVDDSVKLYFDDGESHSVHVPFPVRSLRPVQVGLLLECRPHQGLFSDPSLWPIIFLCVAHPAGLAEEVDVDHDNLDDSHELIHSAVVEGGQHELVVTYCHRTGNHYVWRYENSATQQQQQQHRGSSATIMSREPCASLRCTMKAAV